MNGNVELGSFLGKSEIVLKGEDEKMTNKLAVTSLLYRFKVGSNWNIKVKIYFSQKDTFFVRFIFYKRFIFFYINIRKK